ncbi:MAG: lipid kinase [Acetobacteraceae bacterium]
MGVGGERNDPQRPRLSHPRLSHLGLSHLGLSLAVTDAPALLIVNENSRSGPDVEPFVAALEAGGLRLRREPCVRRDELPEIIQRLRENVSCVILGGGDGTLNAAAGALRDTGLTLGILPLGTANDLARTLGIPADAREAAAVILAGRTRAIDLGSVNGHPFFNVASLGLSVAVTKRLTGIMKRRLGALAYPVAAAAALVRTSRFRATLRVDGEEVLVRTLQVAVGNGRFYGGGMVVEENASIEDGQLDVYSLEPRARWRLIVMARAFRAGELRRLDEVRTASCKTVTVSTRRPREISADGEIVTRTPAHFTVLPQAVRVFAP